MKKQVFFMIALFFVAIAVNAQSAKVTSPDTENQEATTEQTDNIQKNGSEIAGPAYLYATDDDYSNEDYSSSGTPQDMVDAAEDGEIVVIYYNYAVRGGHIGLELNVSSQIKIVHDYVNDPPNNRE